MKKLLLLLTALTLNVALFTGCSSGDDKGSSSDEGAPASLTGKILRARIYVQGKNGTEEITDGDTEYAFISNNTVAWTYYNGYVGTASYTYEKTGSNTGRIQAQVDATESYNFNLTFSGLQFSMTGTSTAPDWGTNVPTKATGVIVQ